MNAHAQAIATYGNPKKIQKTARAAEYEVIAQITSNLQRASKDPGHSFPELVAALVQNRRLWTEFAIDLASTENQLPLSLKLQLLSLARFVEKQTDFVLDGTGSATVLIDINYALMCGLSGKGEQL